MNGNNNSTRVKARRSLYSRERRAPAPAFRRLKVFAYDPGMETRVDTAEFNRAVVKVLWEEELQPGPVGEYLEVVDHDPASQCFYEPVNLNDSHVIADDGVSPSEGSPQFHQQMVYAIAMTTIRAFERALGRRAFWSARADRTTKTVDADKVKQTPADEEYVQRLRIYPHALREANAYYDPDRKALLFGYFPATADDPGRMLPGATVFTCLSHDIIAHETTHALLDGIHTYFLEPSNSDVLAFHEAFADLVAMLQHFTFPEALLAQVARTRGDLASQNLLGQLAREFGEATGIYGALRSAIGNTDKNGRWIPEQPDPAKLARVMQPHARGAILVAAVFDGFLSIYKSRVADLLRIASGGTGILQAGDLHPDLVDRLSQEAAKSADHVLRICIRALDYCPPVDITFGDFLRALVTADIDLVPDDPRGYRIAMIDAFRRRGIYPGDVRSLGQESLRWEKPSWEVAHALERCWMVPEKELDNMWQPGASPKAPSKWLDPNRPIDQDVMASESWIGYTSILSHALYLDWNLSCDRKKAYERSRYNRALLHPVLKKIAMDNPSVADALGLVVTPIAGQNVGTIRMSNRERGLKSFRIYSIRPAYRVGPDGQALVDLVIEIIQTRRGYYDSKVQAQQDTNPPVSKQAERDEEAELFKNRAGFLFRGGCTLIINVETGRIRYLIRKQIRSEERLTRQRQYLKGAGSGSLAETYFGAGIHGGLEVLAGLHGHASCHHDVCNGEEEQSQEPNEGRARR